jgi:hypothetical protein
MTTAGVRKDRRLPPFVGQSKTPLNEAGFIKKNRSPVQ